MFGSSDREIGIDINANDAGASETIKKVGESTKALGDASEQTSSRFGALGSMLSGVFMGVGMAVANAAGNVVHDLEGMVTGSVASAAAMQVANAKLDQALQLTGSSYADNAAAIEDLSAKGIALGFTDGEIVDSMARLVTASGSTTGAARALSVAQDLARLKGISLAQATEALAKIEGGRYMGLSALGINIKQGASLEEALTEVEARAAGQKEKYAATETGAWARVTATWDSASSKLASGLLPMLTDFANFISDDVIPAVTAIADNFGKLVPVFVGLGTAALVFLAPGLYAAVAGFLAMAIAALPVLGPLVALAAAIALLTQLLSEHRLTAEETGPAIQRVGKYVEGSTVAFNGFAPSLARSTAAFQQTGDASLTAGNRVGEFADASLAAGRTAGDIFRAMAANAAGSYVSVGGAAEAAGLRVGNVAFNMNTYASNTALIQHEASIKAAESYVSVGGAAEAAGYKVGGAAFDISTAMAESTLATHDASVKFVENSALFGATAKAAYASVGGAAEAAGYRVGTAALDMSTAQAGVALSAQVASAAIVRSSASFGVAAKGVYVSVGGAAEAAGYAVGTAAFGMGTAATTAASKIYTAMTDIGTSFKDAASAVIAAVNAEISGAYDPLITAAELTAAKLKLSDEETSLSASTLTAKQKLTLEARVLQEEASLAKLKKNHASYNTIAAAEEKIAADKKVLAAAATAAKVSATDKAQLQLQIIQERMHIAELEAQQLTYGTNAEQQAKITGFLTGKAHAAALKSTNLLEQEAAQKLETTLQAELLKLQRAAGTYGTNTGTAYTNGILSGISPKRISDRMEAVARLIRAGSPPGPESPLHLIDKWGFNTTDSWMGGLVGGIVAGKSALSGAMGRLAPAFAGTFGGATFSGATLGAQSAGAPGISARLGSSMIAASDRGGGGGTTININNSYSPRAMLSTSSPAEMAEAATLLGRMAVEELARRRIIARPGGTM